MDSTPSTGKIWKQLFKFMFEARLSLLHYPNFILLFIYTY